MTMTAEEAWDDIPFGLCTDNLYLDLSAGQRECVDDWFGDLVKSVAADKDAKIDQLKTDLELARGSARSWSDACNKLATKKDAEIAELKTLLEERKKIADEAIEAASLAQERAERWQNARDAKDLEIMRLKDQLDNLTFDTYTQKQARELAETTVAKLRSKVDELNAELDSLKPKPPRPRKAAWEKLRDALENHAGHSDFSVQGKHWQSAALELGLTDDPEPPSDGELLRQVMMSGRVTEMHNHWDTLAAEFLRRLAENKGGA